ncbi:hypothetical protein KM043_012841 [Ampulex compressa]|nr:hypothetical protein KM043_012841 [Ampulex compressa]
MPGWWRERERGIEGAGERAKDGPSERRTEREREGERRTERARKEDGRGRAKEGVGWSERRMDRARDEDREGGEDGEGRSERAKDRPSEEGSEREGQSGFGVAETEREARIPDRSVPLHIPHISQVQGVVPCRQYRLQTRAVAHSHRHVDADRQPD